MRVKELAFFKKLLLQQRADILNKAGSFKSEALQERVGHGDEGDQAVSELHINVSLRLQERHVQLLHKVDMALAKIEEGRFGLCESCEEPLGVPRLKARPVANLCLACKEEQESRERLFA